MLSSLKSFSLASLNILLPPRCLYCSQIVEAQGTLCSPCWTSLTFIEAPYCKICSYPFEYHTFSEAICAGCLHNPPPYKQARFLMAYDAFSKKMLLSFKHGDRTYMAPYFSQWLKRITPLDIDIIIPVPLHWTRLFKRGYNQAALLTKELSRIVKIPAYPDLLIRRRKTVSQGGLTRQKRADNVKGAFIINKKYKETIQNKNILIIDDVYTTGATMIECVKVLNQAGAREVSLLTLARVVRPQAAL